MEDIFALAERRQESRRARESLGTICDEFGFGKFVSLSSKQRKEKLLTAPSPSSARGSPREQAARYELSSVSGGGSSVLKCARGTFGTNSFSPNGQALVATLPRQLGRREQQASTPAASPERRTLYNEKYRQLRESASPKRSGSVGGMAASTCRPRPRWWTSLNSPSARPGDHELGTLDAPTPTPTPPPSPPGPAMVQLALSPRLRIHREWGNDWARSTSSSARCQSGRVRSARPTTAARHREERSSLVARRVGVRHLSTRPSSARPSFGQNILYSDERYVVTNGLVSAQSEVTGVRNLNVLAPVQGLKAAEEKEAAKQAAAAKAAAEKAAAKKAADLKEEEAIATKIKEEKEAAAAMQRAAEAEAAAQRAREEMAAATAAAAAAAAAAKKKKTKKKKTEKAGEEIAVKVGGGSEAAAKKGAEENVDNPVPAATDVSYAANVAFAAFSNSGWGAGPKKKKPAVRLRRFVKDKIVARRRSVVRLEVYMARQFEANQKTMNPRVFSLPGSGEEIDMIQMLAAQGDSTAIRDYLAKYPDDVNKAMAEGVTPLMTAAFQNQVNSISILLELGAPIDQPDDNGETALMKAAVAKSSAVIEILMKHGAVREMCDKHGRAVDSLAERAHLGASTEPDSHGYAHVVLEHSLLLARQRLTAAKLAMECDTSKPKYRENLLHVLRKSCAIVPVVGTERHARTAPHVHARETKRQLHGSSDSSSSSSSSSDEENHATVARAGNHSSLSRAYGEMLKSADLNATPNDDRDFLRRYGYNEEVKK